jgi:hypothetical protein
MVDLFANIGAETKDTTIDRIVDEQKALASSFLINALPSNGAIFSKVVDRLLQAYMLRETNIKDICVELALAGKIEDTWGGGNPNRKPRDTDLIRPRHTN